MFNLNNDIIKSNNITKYQLNYKIKNVLVKKKTLVFVKEFTASVLGFKFDCFLSHDDKKVDFIIII